MTRTTIEIDPYACCGHGDCVDVAPQVFALNDDLAIVVGDAPADLLVRAAESCPSAAITITDPATGAKLYP
jgi:ferredoxin